MLSIDIRTSQNVTIEYELAPLRDRVLAFVMDLVLFFVLYMIIRFIAVSLVGDRIYESYFSSYFIDGLLPVGLLILYHLLWEIFGNGQSLGKRILGIRVVRLDGKEPGLSDYLLRAILLLVDFIFSAGMIGMLLIGSSEKRQRLGDLASNTTVVRLRSGLQFGLAEILKIGEPDTYVATYPEVKQLEESDMLFVKNTLARWQKYRNPAHELAIRELIKNLEHILEIKAPAGPPDRFLKQLIRDYIMLTR
ncbi:MAG: RDD family protein [Saprospiraceae bacterium]|nr:RDD family protein [Saprospiraceae bacterium]